MINFSVGLGYIHHALKRQSGNRQYLLAQGLALVFQYYGADLTAQAGKWQQETAYNTGRVFQLLGLNHLAFRYYRPALDRKNSLSLGQDSDDIETVVGSLGAAYNVLTSAILSRDTTLARQILSNNLLI
jgi:general transcription factor 3C polypeptide 3 (transcription factor C subunit 4)